MFQSFFSAGFEGSTGINRNGEWIDQVSATQHDRFLVEDYRCIKALGIHTVRESVRWPLVDKNGRYDLSTLEHLVRASNEEKIEVLYDLFHFGYPQDIDLLSNHFIERFEEYCYTVAKYIKDNSEGPYYFTPINEPSYFSWAAGEAGLFTPHLVQSGSLVKRQLIRAAIKGIEAIWSVIPNAVIINVDPLCHTIPTSPENVAQSHHFNYHAVFESWDMLAGTLHSELGGSMRHLGIVGINYYWTNQWLWDSEEKLSDDDPRRMPLHRLIREVWERYEAPMILSETSHCNEMRPQWLRQLADEVEQVVSKGIPLQNVCLYPILGMPEWHDRSQWTCMGLWDLEPDAQGTLLRVPCTSAIQEFELLRDNVQELIESKEILEA